MSSDTQRVVAQGAASGWRRLALPIICIALLTLTTFSAPGRELPQSVESLDWIGLIKAGSRFLCLALLGGLVAQDWQRPSMAGPRRSFFPFACFLAWAVVSIAWSPLRSVSAGQAISLLTLLLLSMAIAARWRGPRDASLVLLSLWSVLALHCLIVLVVAGVDFEASGLHQRLGTRGVVHPTAAGATSSLGLLIVFSCRWLWNWTWTRRAFLPALFLHGMVLLLSNSRMAVLMTVAIALLAWLMFSSRPMLGASLLAASLCGGVYLMVDPGLEWMGVSSETTTSYLRRGQSGEELSSLSGRTELWDLIWSAFMESPWRGHGYFMTSPTGTLDVWGGTTSETAHNVVLQVMVSTGVVGTCLFAWAFLRPILAGQQQLQGRPAIRRCARFSALLAGWFLGWGMLCESFMGPIQPESVVFFVLLGMVAGNQKTVLRNDRSYVESDQTKVFLQPGRA